MLQATQSTEGPVQANLASADNFRDIAGDGNISAAGGKTVRRGVAFRSNTLLLSPLEVGIVEALGVSDIFDLRTSVEVEKKPDVEISGAQWHHVDVLGASPMAAVTNAAEILRSVDQARTLLTEVNESFVTGAEQREAFGRVLTGIAQSEGAVIFHCTAGKDRTGWLSAVLLSLVGVSRADVLADYLLTNTYSAASIARRAAETEEEEGPEAGAALRVGLGVEPEFLEAGFAAIDNTFGNLGRYLREGLGLSDQTIAALRKKLLG